MFLDLFAPFGVGLVGSLHCLGMCGPLVIAYSLHIKGPEGKTTTIGGSSFQIGLFHHFSFHLGRLLTYGLLGALAAGLFYLADLKTFFLNLRGGVTFLGGMLMIFFGLVLLKIVPLPGFLTVPSMAVGSFWGKLLPSLFKSQRLGSKMALGLATGFLPCGLSWAMIAKAATTGHVVVGFLTMVAFGLGTAPALFVTGFSASYFTLRTRLLGERIAAISIIVMGLIMVMKGGKIFG
jgi:sulfite exporter TauE/SafE